MKKKHTYLRAAYTVFFAVGAVTALAGFLFALPDISSAATVIENALYADRTQSETWQLFNKFGGLAAIQKQTPGVIVFNILQIVLGFLGIVGVIMMVYAGFLWLTARGEEEQAKQGRTLLFQALVGTLIVLAAYTLTYFIISELSHAVTG